MRDMSTESDLIDRLMEDWSRERPDLDAAAMGVVGRIIRLGRLMEARMASLLRQYRLSYTEFDLMATLRRSGAPCRMTPTELCNAVLLSSGAMTAALDRLETKGLIERTRSETDKRVRAAALTPAGRALVDIAIADRFADAQTCLQGLAPNDAADLAALLRRLSLSLNVAPLQADQDTANPVR